MKKYGKQKCLHCGKATGRLYSSCSQKKYCNKGSHIFLEIFDTSTNI